MSARCAVLILGFAALAGSGSIARAAPRLEFSGHGRETGGLYGRIAACGGSALPWLNDMACWTGDREETPTELAALGYDLTITGRLGVWWDDPIPDCWGAIKALY